MHERDRQIVDLQTVPAVIAWNLSVSLRDLPLVNSRYEMS
jgi:hypothetical protein